MAWFEPKIAWDVYQSFQRWKNDVAAEGRKVDNDFYGFEDIWSTGSCDLIKF